MCSGHADDINTLEHSVRMVTGLGRVHKSQKGTAALERIR